MAQQTLNIGNVSYSLNEVVINLRPTSNDEEDGITFDLLADCGDKSLAGFAINAMSIDTATVDQLEGHVFELDEQDDDPHNELRESVVCLPGSVLELSHLKLNFGLEHGDAIEIQLEARCFRLDPDTDEIVETNIIVNGQFLARRAK